MQVPPAFGELVGRLDYPMLVVTAAAGGERSGCLVGFATQCSLDPPRFLVCISRANHTHAVAAGAELLAVHVLTEWDGELARLFGERTGDTTDKFTTRAWRECRGVPVLRDARAWFLGRVLDRVELGDHTGYLLDPVEAELRGELRQLGFQRVKNLNPGHPA